MTAELLTDADTTPAVEVVTTLLSTLWPECSKTQARRHAATLVRLQGRHYGEPDDVQVARLGVLLAPPVGTAAAPAPDTEIPLPYGDLFLRPWTAEMDRRPKTKTPRWVDPDWAPGGSRRGKSQYVGSAQHGECTPCVKDHVLRQAVYRVSDARDSFSRQSVCEKCARKMLGGPVVVPRFATPEEAQAWLDAQE